MHGNFVSDFVLRHPIQRDNFRKCFEGGQQNTFQGKIILFRGGIILEGEPVIFYYSLLSKQCAMQCICVVTKLQCMALSSFGFALRHPILVCKV
jgi:hypothetical protein